MSLAGCVGVDEDSIESEVLGPPTNVAVSATRIDRVVVTWDAVPGAAKYYVYQSTAGGPMTFVGTARAPATELRVAHLQELTNYCFEVRTEDGTGPGAPSAPACLTTPTAPTPPHSVLATPINDTSAFVRWAEVPGATKYFVYQAVGSDPSAYLQTVLAPDLVTSVRDLTPGLRYCYRVAAETQNGTSTLSVPSCTTDLQPPSGVTATRTQATRIRITWQPAAGATKYYVYESRAGAPRVYRGSVLASSALTWQAANLTTGVRYCYQIQTQGSTSTNKSGFSLPEACATP